ncbi:MAG: hypothetical protein IT279_03405 [Ignavibacteriaceae bacterium]|nr:hypothetical protein [Ignavibacteriaceae bacterium]
METIQITREELENIITEKVLQILSNEPEILQEAIHEAIEDICLSNAIDEGKSGEDVDPADIKKLSSGAGD